MSKEYHLYCQDVTPISDLLTVREILERGIVFAPLLIPGCDGDLLGDTCRRQKLVTTIGITEVELHT